jgi:hypothetical protein
VPTKVSRVDRCHTFVGANPDLAVRAPSEHLKFGHADHTGETIEPVEDAIPESVAGIGEGAGQLVRLEAEQPGPGCKPPRARVVLRDAEDRPAGECLVLGER